MNRSLITLPIDPAAIPGVLSVSADDGRMVVEFSNGVTATVARSPLSTFSRQESFDVWLPPTREGFGAEVAPSKSAAEVIAMLTKLATKAADH
jgi:hypothetical protein